MAIIPALMPVITEVTLAAAAASVSLTVPTGYEILFLEWSNVGGDENTAQNIFIQFNGDATGNYDCSYQSFGSASSTSNARSNIFFGLIADADGVINISSGHATIFNRAAQEKVFIGTEAYFDNSAGGGADDLTGKHTEGKWRNTSAEISSLLLYPGAGNFAANSRFILRGLRTSGAPGLGSADIVQFIGSATATGASVTLPTIPAGYGILWLFAHDIGGDNTAIKYITLRFNSDTGNNYDFSLQQYGSASSTTNASTYILIGSIADSDAQDFHSNSLFTIFNRTSQEKVVIGNETFYDNGAGAGADDLIGIHSEAKWRNTTNEISTLTLTPTAGNFAGSGKFWLFGVKIP